MGSKYIIAGGLMGAGAEGVSKLINHAAQPYVSDVDEYIIVNNWSSSIDKVDEIDSSHSSLNLL